MNLKCESSCPDRNLALSTAAHCEETCVVKVKDCKIEKRRGKKTRLRPTPVVSIKLACNRTEESVSKSIPKSQTNTYSPKMEVFVLNETDVGQFVGSRLEYIYLTYC